jgi:hypothetical protein
MPVITQDSPDFPVSCSSSKVLHTGNFDLKVGYINVQGLVGKNLILNDFATENLFDIICVSEHWCRKSEIPYIILQDFQLVNSFCRVDHVHGGVAVFVRSSLVDYSSILDFDLCDELVFEVTGVFFENVKLAIVSLYRSPKGDPAAFLDKLERVFEFFSQPKWNKYRIVIGGDFNADFDVTCDKQRVREFKNLLKQFNLIFCNVKPTRGYACLDNIITNIDSPSQLCDVSEFLFSDHNSVFIAIEYDHMHLSGPEDAEVVVTRPMDDNKVFNFRAYLFNFSWLDVLSEVEHCSAEINFSRFFAAFMSIFDMTIPEKKCKVNALSRRSNRNGKEWYTPQLALLKSRVQLLSDINKVSNDELVKVAYLGVKKEYKSAIIKAKKQHNIKSIEESTNKCKEAWKVIRSVAKNNKRECVTVSPDDFNTFCVQSVNDIQNSILKPDVTAMEILQGSNVRLEFGNFSFSEVTISDVVGVVKLLKSSNSVDAYGLSSNLLKKVIDCIAGPFTFVINKCLAQGCFPNVLKMSRVVPIYKKGDKKCPSSYRPISLTPIFSKVLETVIYNQMCNYLDHCGVLCSEQFGFRKKRSTINAIDSLIKKILQVFEEKDFAQATFCDLSKAFDCVDHELLLDKLAFLGFRQTSLSIFRSYLENRKQVVCVGNNKSEVADVRFGVPQGSVLGPLLFILMINDLPRFVDTHTILYADDTTFINTSCDPTLLETLTDRTLELASKWFRANGFLLNDSKTQNLIFSLRQSCLSEGTGVVKFLGVYLDDKLSWEPHINSVTGKLSRVIYLLKNLKCHVSDKYIRSAYFAFFHSLISYGILLWGNSSHVQNILLLQKKVIRIITDSHRLDHCKPLFVNFKVLTVINLYIFTVVSHTINNLPNQQLRQDVHTHNTRNCKLVNIPYHRLSKSQNSYDVIGLKCYNKLSLNFLKYPVEKLKAKLYNWLVSNPFYSLDEFLKCDNVIL